MSPMERAQARLKLIGQREKQIQRLQELRHQAQVELAEIQRLKAEQRTALHFYDAVSHFEAALITYALEKGNKSISRAAGILGMKHQTLGHILESRHQDIAHLRTPVRQRRPQREWKGRRKEVEIGSGL